MTEKNAARRGNGEPVEIEAKQPNSAETAHFVQRTAKARGDITPAKRPDATTRPLRPVVPLERHLMRLVEDRRAELGWPMWLMDDRAGTGDGHYAKCVAAASPEGRRPTLPTLDLFFSAAFTRNYKLTVTPLDPMLSAPGIAPSSYNANGRMVRHWRHRRHFQALGMMGGIARMAKLTNKQKTALGKRAARKRWQRHRMTKPEETLTKKPQPQGRGFHFRGGGRFAAPGPTNLTRRRFKSDRLHHIHRAT